MEAIHLRAQSPNMGGRTSLTMRVRATSPVVMCLSNEVSKVTFFLVLSLASNAQTYPYSTSLTLSNLPRLSQPLAVLTPPTPREEVIRGWYRQVVGIMLAQHPLMFRFWGLVLASVLVVEEGERGIRAQRGKMISQWLSWAGRSNSWRLRKRPWGTEEWSSLLWWRISQS